jgi:hypothetical protein
MKIQHKNLAAGRWHKLSLAEQMGNIGSETQRALNWREKDQKIFINSIYRALELLDLTIADPRWRKRLKEIVRAREFLCEAVFGNNAYKTSLEDLNRYFFQFAVAARLKR